MAYSIYHAELGIELNLTEPDLGHPHIPNLWEQLRADKRPVPERGLQCMKCRESRPDCPEWMFLSERDGRRFASHFTRGIADHDTNESDQHKAYKERIARAAQVGGHAAELEDRAEDGKRRTDVLVKGNGDLAIGWEVQLSYASLDSVRKRSRIALADGITPVWATVDETREFINRVPWALMRNLEWKHIRGGTDIDVRGGLRRLDLWRCDNVRRPCPVKGHGGCGQFHDEWTPVMLILDELVRKTAAGEYVPIIIGGAITRRYWVKASDRDRYADNSGGLLAEDDLLRPRNASRAADTDPRPLDSDCRYGQDSGYRAAPAKVRDDGSPTSGSATFATAATLPAAPVVHLDWRHAKVSATPKPCVICGRAAFMLSPETGKPCHKTCAENQAAS